MVRGTLSPSCVEAVARCRNLNALKLSLDPRIGWAPFIRVFTECRRLSIVDIYTATDVSDQLLGCIMLNLSSLEEFNSSRLGGNIDSSHTLSNCFIEAFKAHFSKSRKIVIDNLVADSIL